MASMAAPTGSSNAATEATEEALPSKPQQSVTAASDHSTAASAKERKSSVISNKSVVAPVNTARSV